jgi:hypothetical protein
MSITPDEEDAVQFLEDRGYVLTCDLDWMVPDGRHPTEAELGAICFLYDNHEFGGFHGVKESDTVSGDS